MLAVHVQWAQHAITLPHLQFNAPQDITGQKAVMGYVYVNFDEQPG